MRRSLTQQWMQAYMDARRASRPMGYFTPNSIRLPEIWRPWRDQSRLTIVPRAEFLAGSTQYLSTPDAADLDGATTMTWEFFRNPISLSGGAGYASKYNYGSAGNKSWAIMAGGGGNGGNNILFRIPDAAVAAAGADTGLSDCLFPASQATLQPFWSHCFIYFNGAGAGNAQRVRVWLDGIEQTGSFTGNAVAAAIANGGYEMRIGHGGNGIAALMDGGLSRFRMTKNRVFTEAEIQAYVASMYNGGDGKWDRDLSTAEKVGLVVSADLDVSPYVDKAAAPHTFTQQGGTIGVVLAITREESRGTVPLVYRSEFWRAPRYLLTGGPNGTPCAEYVGVINQIGQGSIADFATGAWPSDPTSGDLFFWYNHVATHDYSELTLMLSATDENATTYYGPMSIREGATNNYRMTMRTRNTAIGLDTQVPFSAIYTPNTWHLHHFRKQRGANLTLTSDGVVDAYSGSPSAAATASWYDTISPRNNVGTGALKRSDGTSQNNKTFRLGDVVQFGPSVSAEEAAMLIAYLNDEARTAAVMP